MLQTTTYFYATCMFHSFQNTSCRKVFILIQFFIQPFSNCFNNNNNINNKSIWIPLSRRKEKKKKKEMKNKKVSIYNIRYTQASILKGLQDHIHPTIFAPFLPQPTSKKGWGAILSLWSENSPPPLYFSTCKLPSFFRTYTYCLLSLHPLERRWKKCNTWKRKWGGGGMNVWLGVCTYMADRIFRRKRGECLLSFYDRSLTLPLPLSLSFPSFTLYLIFLSLFSSPT